MSQIVNARLTSIDANPHRLEHKYPFNEKKLETLQRSYADVGMWEGVIARKKSNRYEIAFGHHRVEAAKRTKLKTVPVIVRDLSDKEMLQFMGRENLEEYNTEFLVMLESWESAAQFAAPALQNPKPIEIARLLGWTQAPKTRQTDQMNQTAKACSAGYVLINAGYLSRDDLKDVSVRAATDICTRAQTRMEQIEKLGKSGTRSHSEIQIAKKQVAMAAKSTAKAVQKGQLKPTDVAGNVDVDAYRFARKSKKQTPLFAAFADAVVKQIAKSLKDDQLSEKLQQVADSVDIIKLDEDRAALREIDFALAELGERTTTWRKYITPKGKKVVPLKLLQKEMA